MKFPMRASLLFLSVPLAAALAFAPHGGPQDPVRAQNQGAPDQENGPMTTIMSIAEIQYKDLQGITTKVSARSVVEVRLFDDHRDRIRIELLYDNGDYSMIDAQAVHVLRNGAGTRDVKFVRTNSAGMRFPKLP